MKKVLVLVIVLLSACSCQKEEEKKTAILSVDCSVMETMVNNGAILIDVRSKEEFNQSSLNNAINIPVSEITDKIKDVVSDKNESIIVYCQSGGRSYQAAQKLIDLGYKNIYDLGSITNCQK